MSVLFVKWNGNMVSVLVFCEIGWGRCSSFKVVLKMSDSVVVVNFVI